MYMQIVSNEHIRHFVVCIRYEIVPCRFYSLEVCVWRAVYMNVDL